MGEAPAAAGTLRGRLAGAGGGVANDESNRDCQAIYPCTCSSQQAPLQQPHTRTPPALQPSGRCACTPRLSTTQARCRQSPGAAPGACSSCRRRSTASPPAANRLAVFPLPLRQCSHGRGIRGRQPHGQGDPHAAGRAAAGRVGGAARRQPDGARGADPGAGGRALARASLSRPCTWRRLPIVGAVQQLTLHLPLPSPCPCRAPGTRCTRAASSAWPSTSPRGGCWPATDSPRGPLLPELARAAAAPLEPLSPPPCPPSPRGLSGLQLPHVSPC